MNSNNEDWFSEILNRKNTVIRFSLVSNPEKGCEIILKEFK